MVIGSSISPKLKVLIQPLSVWQAGLKPSQEMGLRPDGDVLDIRAVDVVSARLLPQIDIPVFVVTFRTQEVHVYRDIKTAEVKAGVEDRIQQVPVNPTVLMVGNVYHAHDSHCGGAVSSRNAGVENHRICPTDSEGLHVKVNVKSECVGILDIMAGACGITKKISA
jgi:Tim44-like domain